MAEEKFISQLKIEELAKNGEEIYQKKLKSQLEPEKNGKYVAIEIMSSQYFIGETKEEALDSAQKSFPDTIFFVRRIGELEKVSSKYSFDFSLFSNYDRLF